MRKDRKVVATKRSKLLTPVPKKPSSYDFTPARLRRLKLTKKKGKKRLRQIGKVYL